MKAPEVVRKNDNVRVVVRTAAELFDEGKDDKGKYVGGKWGGLYLRAPDIFFRILEKAGDKLVRLGDVAEVRRGFTTGANDFFYVDPLPYNPVCPVCKQIHEDGNLVAVRNGLAWEGYLEKQVLKPLLKSPKDAPSLQVDAKDLGFVFLPGAADFQKLPTHAQAYVRYGERAPIEVKRGTGKGKIVQGVPSLRTVKGRSPWWWLGKWPPAKIVLPMFERGRKYAFWNSANTVVDNALYFVLPKSKTNTLALFLALNSTFFALVKEVLARPPEGGGGGPLQIKVYDYEAMPIPPLSPPPSLDEELLGTFMTRTIPDFWEEVGLRPPDFRGLPTPPPDRRELDNHVFKLLGLTRAEREEVYRETAKLVWERIALAKSNRRRKSGATKAK